MGVVAPPSLAASIPFTGDPIGQVDEVSVGPGRVTARGWAVDADVTSAPVIVQMFVDGRSSTMAWATSARPDVGATYPVLGPMHGFSLMR